nr:HD domain-containing protein [Vibrio sinus]
MQQDPAHDINHVIRVVSMAKSLCYEEKANIDVVLPAAYLHDCFTFPKNHPNRALSSVKAADKALSFLNSCGYPKQFDSEIHHAIVAHSYSANVVPETLEAKIVQDADRLDSLGAIGIARCIQVSASFGSQLYSADDPFCDKRETQDKAFTVDHFFTKLFKLESLMNTDSAKAEASRRTQYMKGFLNQLKQEIE